MSNQERDKRKIKELQKLGWKVITIWECQIKGSLQDRIARIKL